MCKRFLPLLILLVTSSAVVFAQHQTTNYFKSYRELADKNSAKGKAYKRMSWGVGKHIVDNSLTLTVQPIDAPTGTVTTHLQTQNSMAAFASSFNVISQFSDQIGLVFDYGLSIAMWNFRYDSVAYKKDYYTGSYSATIGMMTGAVPLSLDFKAGGEMSLEKEDKLLFTAGMGVAPWFGMNDTRMRFGVKPFLKLELGFHAGLAFKLRGMFFMGEGNFIKDDGEIGSNIIKRKSTGNFGTTIGLSVMPFSWDWDKNKW